MHITYMHRYIHEYIHYTHFIYYIDTCIDPYNIYYVTTMALKRLHTMGTL